jgi:spermidine/putrescine transport system substrate-binding protein
MNSLDDIHLAEVKQLLLKQRPLIQAYTSDDYKERLIKGDTWVALGWSGDILQARKEQSNVKAIIPESGTMLWIDAMAIPKGARQTELAHRFIDFLSDPEIAAKNANFVRYASPNLTAKAKLDADLLNDPAVYPSAEILSRCEWLLDRGEGIRKIEKLWNEVRNE